MTTLDGYVILSDIGVLRAMIKDSKIPLTGRVPSNFGTVTQWRKNNVKHTFQECLISIQEEVQNDVVYGVIKCKSKQDGMPEMELYLKNSSFDDFKMHRCVKVPRFLREGVISFLPADGESLLFEYWKPLKEQPLKITKELLYDAALKKGKLSVTVQTLLKMEGLKLDIQVPQGFKVKLEQGILKDQVIEWRIGKAKSQETFIFQASVEGLDQQLRKTELQVQASYKMPNFLISGLRIERLSTKQETYK